LYLTPVIYLYFEQLQERLQRRRARKGGVAKPAPSHSEQPAH